MKIWVLDGDILDYCSGIYTDIDINNPTNHFRWLLNELTFLDRYIKTKEDTLDTANNEQDIDELKQAKEMVLNDWVNTINSETGKLNKDYELPYDSRPTLLGNSQFENLYDAFKIKRTAGELSTALEIVDKVTNYCIDIEAVEAEDQLTSPDSTAVYESIIEQADNEKERNDRNFVENMNIFYDEIFGIIQTLLGLCSGMSAPDWQTLHSYVEGNKVRHGSIYNCVQNHTSGLTFIEDVDKWEVVAPSTRIANLPHKRVQVVLTKDDSSHKGIIAAEEGYRFAYKDVNGVDSDIPVNPTMNINASNIKTDEVEWGFEDVKYVRVYVTSKPGGATTWVEDFSPVVNKSLLPSDSTCTYVDCTCVERFDILNERWETMNNLRENKIQNMGTRIILESMVDAEIPEEITDDKEDYYVTKTGQKGYYTDILKEICLEFI